MNVYIWGAFDIIHKNHIKFLKEANKYGDVYVILTPNDIVKKYKLLYHDAKRRKQQLLKTRLVKKVYIDKLPHIRCFKQHIPHLFVFGYDQNEIWKLKLKKYISKRYPYCKFQTLKKYGWLHSSYIKKILIFLKIKPNGKKQHTK